MNADLIRELADLRPERGKVLSLYLDLDPSEFATADARESAVTSLTDEADRLIGQSGAGGEELRGLREDLERAREFLSSQDYAGGARALALFCCGPSGLFRPEKLDHAVESGAFVDDRPHLEPLAQDTRATDWAVLLVNRAHARLLRGTREGLHELGRLSDDPQGRHTHGVVSEELKQHLDRTGEGMRVAHRRSPFSALLLGGQSELLGILEERLPPEVQRLVAGRLELDVQDTSPEDVLALAAPAMDKHEQERVGTQLDRLREGAAHGTGALGLEQALSALTEQRVEVLMLEEGFTAAGVQCPACGWLGPEGKEQCPADGTVLEHLDDVVEAAVRRAVEQSAEVLPVRERDELRPFGGVAALLRF